MDEDPDPDPVCICCECGTPITDDQRIGVCWRDPGRPCCGRAMHASHHACPIRWYPWFRPYVEQMELAARGLAPVPSLPDLPRRRPRIWGPGGREDDPGQEQEPGMCGVVGAE